MNIVKLILFIPAIAFFTCQPHKVKVKIACVGDSITEGYGISEEDSKSYPAILDSLLGEKYTVQNAGRSAATLQKEGNFPYWHRKEFSNVFKYQPDIIVIKLGTNDTKPVNWNPSRFEEDYQALIDTFQTIPTHPKIYLCQPVPVFETNWEITDSVLVNGILPVISEIATKNNLTLINLYQKIKNQGVNFPDGIHPNAAGAKEIAEVVAEVIKKENPN